jgi:hypothetical protein
LTKCEDPSRCEFCVSRLFYLPNLDPRDLMVTFDFAQDDTLSRVWFGNRAE